MPTQMDFFTRGFKISFHNNLSLLISSTAIIAMASIGANALQLVQVT